MSVNIYNTELLNKTQQSSSKLVITAENNIHFIYDDYNKFTILRNIYENLIFNLKFQKIEESLSENSDILEFYENINTIYQIKRNFTSLNQEEISLMFVNNKDILNSCSLEGNLLYRDENVQLKLLSLFEEEVRTFIKNKNELKFKLIQIRSSHDNSKNSINISELNKKFLEIFNLITENFDLISEIFEHFKIKEIDSEEKDLKFYRENFCKINTILESMLTDISDKMTSEQSYILLNHINQGLQNENIIIEVEIEKMKNKLVEYDKQGEELSELVKEYRKICNLIECKKLDK